MYLKEYRENNKVPFKDSTDAKEYGTVLQTMNCTSNQNFICSCGAHLWLAGIALDWSVRELNEKQSQDDKERLHSKHGLLHITKKVKF